MIEIESLTVRYPSGVTPILNLSARWPADRPLLLVGANGSGKSTLGRVLCGLIEPATGTATIGGRQAYRLRSRDRLSLAQYIPQRAREAFLYPSLADDIKQVSAPSGSRHIENEVSRFRLERFMQEHPLDVPEPVAWRAALCIGYVSAPKLLFIDEVLGLSSDLVRDLLSFVVRERAIQGKFTIIASHRDELPVGHRYGIMRL